MADVSYSDPDRQDYIEREGWAAAERFFPGCSAEWDVLGAPFEPRLKVKHGLLWACVGTCNVGLGHVPTTHGTECLQWRDSKWHAYEAMRRQRLIERVNADLAAGRIRWPSRPWQPRDPDVREEPSEFRREYLGQWLDQVVCQRHGVIHAANRLCPECANPSPPP